MKFKHFFPRKTRFPLFLMLPLSFITNYDGITVFTGVDLTKILGGTRSGQSAITDDIIGVSGAT